MISSFLSLFLLVAQADEPPQVTDGRPEIKTLVETLNTHLKARGEQDDKAIETLDQLTKQFPESGPKDRALIVKEVAGVFDVKRPKEIEEGVPDDRAYMAAATALGTMGPESVKPLASLIGDKNHRKNQRLQIKIALSLGKTKSPEAVETLLDLLKHKDPPMQAAGAEALANYFDADQETRKRAFEPLLNTLMDQRAKKDADTTDAEALERWNIISGPILATLQKLTGRTETDPEFWLHWWNDNKKKDWGPKAG
jgi:sulfite reductase alpha subunit-like flavoprotein